MKAPITAAQAMRHPTVVDTINALGEMVGELRSERNALLDRLEKAEKDAQRYRGLIGGKRRKYIWNHVLTGEEKEGHGTLEQVLDTMEASK